MSEQEMVDARMATGSLKVLPKTAHEMAGSRTGTSRTGTADRKKGRG